MPRIPRWFNVSHDINSDPEVWELTDTFGDWMLRVWLQLLSVADRNDGVIKGELRWIGRSMSYLWGSNSRRYNTEWRANKITMACEWMANKGWIKIESDRIVVCNHALYHPRRGNINAPSGGKTSSPPSEPSLPSLPIREKKIIKEKRATRFPETFIISESLSAWCNGNGFVPDAHLDAFRDFHVAKGSRFLDWEAAFRNWLRNSKKFAGNGQRPINKEQEQLEKQRRMLERGLDREKGRI